MPQMWSSYDSGVEAVVICIASGKGGTGKASVVASFAALAARKVLVDADVDAADLHLILSPHLVYEQDFKGVHTATIDPDVCTECGECIERCQFNAISADFAVNKIDGEVSAAIKEIWDKIDGILADNSKG